MEIKACYAAPDQWADQKVEVSGWVRQARASKNIVFLMVNDGTFFKPLQVVVDQSSPAFGAAARLSTGSAVRVTGTIHLTPQAKQPMELAADDVEVLGDNASDYPLQNKRQTMEFLRNYPHLRSRTNTFNAVFRLRSEIAFALHEFFHDNGFVYIHTPIITSSDAEGAGEMFQVTTLDLEHLPQNEDHTVNYKQDFFGVPAHLTVSGQLEVESFAMTHRKVYTFGPTFRAEHSNTTRHAAEFWMVEPEIAFADLNDVMDLAEEMTQSVIAYVMERLPEEMEFFNQWIDKGLIERLTAVRDTPFVRMTYTEAIDILEKVNDRFEVPVEWGIDLQSEHERYLTEEYVKGPMFLTDYPKEIKAFYMRLNDDQKTVACADMLVPGIGELIGASQREEREEVLIELMREKHMSVEEYQWYVDLRRFGGCAHGGFGLGFERLVMYMSGMGNIRDVLPYPRTVRTLR